MKFLKKRIITAFNDTPYLTRYILFRCKWLGIFLHVFHRSDYDRALHCHPFNFISIILWNGYYEHTDNDVKFYYPGSILYRPATWKHRVELPNNKKTISLVFVGKRIRKWGFWLDKETWCWWRKYNPFKGICEEEILWTDNDD